jgi:hypothetical protein
MSIAVRGNLWKAPALQDSNFMQTPLEFLDLFRAELRAADIRFAITSGMACIRYGLQQTTKDSDWIVSAAELRQLRGLLERCEHRLPPWVVQYRPIFGAPLEPAWLDGGWSTHIFIRTVGGGPDHHLDFFCRPPRAAAWRHDSEEADFADRDTVTRMKKTDRDKDWPIVGGLAAQAFARGEPAALLHLRDASLLRRAWSKASVGEQAKAVSARPLLARITSNADDLRLESLLRAERLVWEAVNRRRYAVYQEAWKTWYRRWQASSDWPWPVSEPFAAQHERVTNAAREHGLPPAPLAGAVRGEVYAEGCRDAAVLANMDFERLADIAPPIEEVLP